MCSCEKRNISPAFLQRDPADGDPSDVRCHVCHFQQLQASQAFPRTQTGKARGTVTITVVTTVQRRFQWCVLLQQPVFEWGWELVSK